MTVIVVALLGALLVERWLTASRIADRRTGLESALRYTARALEDEGSRAVALGAAMLMGLNDPVLKAAALGEMSPDATQVLERLSIARSLFEADGAYVIAASGKIVAHSTEGKRSTGTNVAFRPYFKTAIQGAANSYAAVGSVSAERGLYYAAPLYGDNRQTSGVIGVVMLKMPSSKTDQLLRFAGDDALLLSPQGVVFASTRADWIYRMSPPITEARLKDIRELHQFAARFNATTPVALPFDTTADTLELDGNRYIVLREKVQWSDPAGAWLAVSLHPLDGLISPLLRFMLGVTTFAILALLGLLLMQVLVGRRRFAAARMRYRTLGTALELSPLSVVIAKADTAIDWVNPQFAQDTGYSLDSLKGMLTSAIVTPEIQPEKYREMIQTVRSGRPWRGDFLNRRKDGSVFTARTVVSPVLDAQGKVNGIVALLEDTTKARQLQEQLAEQVALQKALMDTIPIPVFYKGPDARFQGMNRAFEDAFRLRREDLIGKTFAEIKLGTADARAFYQREDEQVIREALSVRRELKIPYANREVRSTLYMVQGFRKANNEPGGLIGTLVDLSEQERAQDQLRRAKDAADAANRAKGDFLANMSHEIRTPMNAIIGMAYLVMKTELSPRQADFISKIQLSGKSLLGIIDDILDISKVEAGKLNIERVVFELSNVTSQVVNVIGEKASAKGLKLVVEVAPDVPNLLVGDPLRLGQILINYANNAVKFTHHGEIKISIRVKEKSADDLLLAFDVTDTGIGISPEVASRLFRSFEQADTSTTRQFGGSGLGLAISKGLAKLMGGSVGVTGALGEGCTFWFTARVGLANTANKRLPSGFGPLSPSHALTDDYTLARQALLPVAGARILLVEDNDLNQEVASAMLAEVGFVVDVAENGRVAVQKVATSNDIDQPYDLVLMDLQMPVLDGLGATAEIRQDSRNEYLPIAAMTANAMQEDRERCKRAGMAGFIVKPVEPIELWRTLVRLIRPREGLGSAVPSLTEAPFNEANPSPGQANQSVMNALATVSGLDIRLGLRRVMGRQPLYLVLLRKFAASQTHAVHEIRAALNVGDIALAERVAHTLKGVAGSIGATELERDASALENAIHANATREMIDTALLPASLRLDTLVAGLNEKLPATATQELSQTDQAEHVGMVCAQLARLLAEQDFEAEEVFEQNRDVLAAALGTGFAPLKSAIETLKFDQALIALNTACLAHHIKIR
jgi:PAS domain S-box-containing protein